MIKEIQLNEEFKTIIDEKYFDEVSKYKWYPDFHKKNNKKPPRAMAVIKQTDNKIKLLSLARLIAQLAGNDITKINVLHKNGDKLDNRLENLIMQPALIKQKTEITEFQVKKSVKTRKKYKNSKTKTFKKSGGISVHCPGCDLKQQIPTSEFYRVGGDKCIACGCRTIRKNPSKPNIK